ncbi:hypothetical protein W97_06287 [Coniosporium apollinis CBS 100218]|uniref:Utp14-domain-containing protein n=1 Tax=Coniosporium apollinis (strain CBS 100218) TaxID=1168221 RepID=R7YYL8_CONA1|nr:uncharacterized protein W97_06287 [Coniosporium apollinis CBS 100218]EON66884.1 hypothetical protein W97_06287 [Coniosporium apollinis CBS 100218]
MPPRVARSSIASSKPTTARKKNQKRTLNALSIAAAQNPESHKVRQHRLGEAEDDAPRRKRQRLADDDEGDEDGEVQVSNPRKKVAKGRFDELDIESGSDSEGNSWMMGHVGDEDDEDLDSDEAFGSSDEERFEGFTFRGSSGLKQKKKPRRKVELAEDGEAGLDLDEGEDVDGEEDDDESLGEDAVDLATALDQYEESEDEEPQASKRKRRLDNEGDHGSDFGGFSDEAGEDDETSDFSMSDADDDADANQLSKLQDLISSLDAESASAGKKRRGVDVHESSAPSDYGLTASTKLKIEDLLPTVTDPRLKKSLKIISSDKPSKRSGIPGKLEAPLPKRQQDRLNRTAANEKAKETLERWVDTVKHNRRAEHLQFPMKAPQDAAEPLGTNKLLPTSSSAPLTDLESTIQDILQQSGLASTNGRSDEDQIRAFEELQTNKMPVEEVLARRAELRKARDLLFREEIRAKRIKKIKSKSYRRVHRKERERAAQQEKDAFAAAGIDNSEDERERNDRRRAEERMGAKHRESKWAKGIKQTGRAAWDDDARAGVTEMARRNEELRRRIEGKDIRDEEDDKGTDISSEESEDDEELDINGGEARRLQRQLRRAGGSDSADESTTKLGSMKFMQRAEAARKAQNDEDIERMRRELAGEETPSDEEEEKPVGRRILGPTPKTSDTPVTRSARDEFEERFGSEDEDEVDIVLGDDTPAAPSAYGKGRANGHKIDAAAKKVSLSGRNGLHKSAPQKELMDDSENPWLVGPIKKSRGSKDLANGEGAQLTLDTLQANGVSTQKKKSKPVQAARETEAPADADGWTTVTYKNQNGTNSNDSDESDGETHKPFVLRNDDLVAKAFAGDAVVADFSKGKAATAIDQDEKVIDNTLPGWGSWTGAGISKREKARAKNRFVTKQEGVRAADRKDARLKHVVINEKRVKKNAKYLASQLPHPFESREQYERSLRLAVLPEVVTKETLQDFTKPRVLIKPGAVIRPLEKPLL